MNEETLSPAEEQNAESPLNRYTQYFLINLCAIVVLGLIMVYSASYISAKEIYGSSIYYFSRQIAYVLAGMGIAFIISKTKFNFWLKYSFYIHVGCIFLLLLTFFPGIGITVKGAHRWLNLGFIKLQPGEITKFTLLLSSLYYFENFETFTGQDRLKYGTLLLLPLGLLLMQPDYGSFMICFFVIILVCFLSSFPRKYFYALVTSGLVVAILALMFKAYRVKRLLTFLDPWKNPRGSGFQIIQSYLAFANGSLFGQGLGNSNEKLFYLPEAHNDFIFSVVGEELGFIGVLTTVILFISLIYLGLRVALSTGNRILSILISSIVLTIGCQTTLNMGVVLGLLPTKGLNLPFISYGGSSMIANFFAVGLMISAVRYARDLKEEL